MKPKLVILSLLLLLSGCEQKPRYEFHTGGGGLILWRCDTKTGDAYWATPKSEWQLVGFDMESVFRDVDKHAVSISNMIIRLQKEDAVRNPKP